MRTKLRFLRVLINTVPTHKLPDIRIVQVRDAAPVRDGSSTETSRCVDVPPQSALNPDYEYALPPKLALLSKPPSKAAGTGDPNILLACSMCLSYVLLGYMYGHQCCIRLHRRFDEKCHSWWRCRISGDW